MTLDEMSFSEGIPAVVTYLEMCGWICEKAESVGYTLCKKPGTGIVLILPSPDKQTGKVSLMSHIVVLIGE